MTKMVDVTGQLQRHATSSREIEVPPAIRCLTSGLSDRMGCIVRVKAVTVTDDRYRLTLELSDGCMVQPRSQSLLNYLRQGPVVMKKKAKNLIVSQGHKNFISNCCAQFISVLNGIARDHQYHEIELVLFESPLDDIKAIEAMGSKRARRLSD